MLMGIAAEGVSLYRGWQEAIINNSKIEEAKATACLARAKALKETPIFQPDISLMSAYQQLAKDCGADFATPGNPALSAKRSFKHRPDAIDSVVEHAPNDKP